METDLQGNHGAFGKGQDFGDQLALGAEDEGLVSGKYDRLWTSAVQSKHNASHRRDLKFLASALRRSKKKQMVLMLAVHFDYIYLTCYFIVESI